MTEGMVKMIVLYSCSPCRGVVVVLLLLLVPVLLFLRGGGRRYEYATEQGVTGIWDGVHTHDLLAAVITANSTSRCGHQGDVVRSSSCLKNGIYTRTVDETYTNLMRRRCSWTR
jgi:hypothetical protein